MQIMHFRGNKWVFYYIPSYPADIPIQRPTLACLQYNLSTCQIASGEFFPFILYENDFVQLGKLGNIHILELALTCIHMRRIEDFGIQGTLQYNSMTKKVVKVHNKSHPHTLKSINRLLQGLKIRMGDYLIYVQNMWVGTYPTHQKSFILVFHIENVALLNLIFSSF